MYNSLMMPNKKAVGISDRYVEIATSVVVQNFALFQASANVLKRAAKSLPHSNKIYGTDNIKYSGTK